MWAVEVCFTDSGVLGFRACRALGSRGRRHRVRVFGVSRLGPSGKVWGLGLRVAWGVLFV